VKSRTFKSYAQLVAYCLRRPGKLYHTLILHDDACAFPTSCTCRPDFILEDGTVENVMRGAKSQAEWRKSRAS
jgi:hypothetical protein